LEQLRALLSKPDRDNILIVVLQVIQDERNQTLNCPCLNAFKLNLFDQENKNPENK
jgi:hypothetical protein